MPGKRENEAKQLANSNARKKCFHQYYVENYRKNDELNNSDMARRVPWRRVCPDVVMSRIDEAIQARIYLLRETGPTGFLLKEDGSDRKLKVCFHKFKYFY